MHPCATESSSPKAHMVTFSLADKLICRVWLTEICQEQRCHALRRQGAYSLSPSQETLRKDINRIIALNAIFSFQRQKPIWMKWRGLTVMRDQNAWALGRASFIGFQLSYSFRDWPVSRCLSGLTQGNTHFLSPHLLKVLRHERKWVTSYLWGIHREYQKTGILSPLWQIQASAWARFTIGSN